MPDISPLPPRTILHDSYTIRFLVSETDTSYLYEALCSDGSQVYLREFVIKSIATREATTGAIRYPSGANPQEQLDAFMEEFQQGAIQQIRENGTILLVYPLRQRTAPRPAALAPVAPESARQATPMITRPVGAGTQATIPAHPAPPTMRPPRRSSSGLGGVLAVVAFLMIGLAYMGYLIMQDKQEIDNASQTSQGKHNKYDSEQDAGKVRRQQHESTTPPAVVTTTPTGTPTTPKGGTIYDDGPIPDKKDASGRPLPTDIAAVEDAAGKSYTPSDAITKKKAALMASLAKDIKGKTGQTSDATITLYNEYAEAYVRDYMHFRGGYFSAEAERWLKESAHAAIVFGTIYPIDPNVAGCAAFLIDAVGFDMAKKYAPFVTALAVARRKLGMGSFDLGHQSRMGDASSEGIGMQGAYRSLSSPMDLYCAGMRPLNYYGPNPQKVSESEEEAAYEKLAKHLLDKQLSPRQAWDTRDAGDGLQYALNVDEQLLKKLLYEYMYRNNLMARKRDPFATPVEFFNFLVDKYESAGRERDAKSGTMVWKGVPLDVTPWAIMMPLAETRPIREAEYVWHRYKGKLPKTPDYMKPNTGVELKKYNWSDSFDAFYNGCKTMPGPQVIGYGSYRADSDDPNPEDYSFDVDPGWALTSQERKVHTGGVCGTMSLIARTTFVSLGIPAPGAGQPGHGNLLSYYFGSGGCTMKVGHSVATLQVTTSFSFTQDDIGPRNQVGEQFQGLALAQNLQAEAYDKSRFLINIYKAYDESGSSTSDGTDPAKDKMLAQVLEINPFCSSAWYAAYENMPKKGMLPTRDKLKEMHAKLGYPNRVHKTLFNRKPERIPRGVENQHITTDTLMADATEYMNAVEASIIEIMMDSPEPEKLAKDEWQEMFSYFSKVKNDNPYACIRSAYILAKANVRGPEETAQSVAKQMNWISTFYKARRDERGAKLDVDVDELLMEVRGILPVLADDNKRAAYIKDIILKSPPAVRYKEELDKIRAKNTEFLDGLLKDFNRLADSSDKLLVNEDIAKGKEEFEKQLKRAFDDAKKKARSRRTGR